MNKTKY